MTRSPGANGFTAKPDCRASSCLLVWASMGLITTRAASSNKGTDEETSIHWLISPFIVPNLAPQERPLGRRLQEFVRLWVDPTDSEEVHPECDERGRLISGFL